MTEYVEQALVPFDRARVRVLRWLMPLSSRLAAAREARVAVIGVSVMALALLGTLVAPLWMLALGPIVLGVPHLLADVRYCVVRPGWQRERIAWLTAGVPLLAVAFGAGFEWGLVGVAASVVALGGDRRRALVVAAVALSLGFAVWKIGSLGDLIFAHAHNFVAVALWSAWRRRTSKLHWIPLGLFGLASAALLLGLGDAGLDTAARWLPEGLRGEVHLRSLAPGAPGVLAGRLVLLYCFAQAVHYGIWLRMVPEDDRERETPRSFRASYRALAGEFHPLVLGLFGLATLGLAIWACVDLVAARSGYLRFARFHGTLELIAAGLLIARARPRSRGPA